VAVTKRKAEALDEAKRVLEAAEKAAGTGEADKLIRIADRWLEIAKESA